MTNKTRITSIGLITLLLNTPDFYLAHLSGINKPLSLLPFTLPYKPTNRPMFSEMSFKCRSTSSFSSSSYTLTDPNSDPLYTLYPTRPEKAYGLGIYAPKQSTTTSSSSSSSFSTTSFLTPRPSLKTIRSQASLGGGPRAPHLHSKPYPIVTSSTSPLPPGPTYNPDKHRNFPVPRGCKKSSSSSGPPPPPRRAYTLKRRGSQGTLRVVLRSPSCPLMLSDRYTGHNDFHEKGKSKSKHDGEHCNATVDNPLARTQSLSAESLSGVYSRSLSDDDPDPETMVAGTTSTTVSAAPALTAWNQRACRQEQQRAPVVIDPSVTSIVEYTPLRTMHAPWRSALALRSGGGVRASAAASKFGFEHRSSSSSSSALRNHFPGPGHHGQRNTVGKEIQSGRLRATRAVSGFGDVRVWGGSSDGISGGVVSDELNGSSWAARCGLPPLPVEEVRGRVGGIWT